MSNVQSWSPTPRNRPLIILTQIVPESDRSDLLNTTTQPIAHLALTAEERTRTRYCHRPLDGPSYLLRLKRGTILHPGDWLTGDTHQIVAIEAQPEAVLTVTASSPHNLLRAAYHLGNRHVPVEIRPTYLRLAPDPVLRSLLMQLGLGVQEEIQPFQPERGAYHHH